MWLNGAMEKQHISNIEEFEVFVHDFVELLKNSKKSARPLALVISLKGNLGAGKTTFVQMLARELGIIETITSPTFVIQKRYDIKKVPDPFDFKKLIHIDAYRLDSEKELEDLDWSVLVSDPQNLICIEWPENVQNLIPKDAIVVEIDMSEDGGRDVKFSN